ncbi:hypothetical protein ACFQ0B_21650 [Nonomuraea thailandensis]
MNNIQWMPIIGMAVGIVLGLVGAFGGWARSCSSWSWARSASWSGGSPRPARSTCPGCP